MMRGSGSAVLAIAMLGAISMLGGCPSPGENAPTVWLALDGRETEVKLIDHEPPPY